MSVERAFVALALVFGTALVALTPPFQVPDESDHVFRAYLLSEGFLAGQRRAPPYGDFGAPNTTGGVLPVGLAALARAFEPLDFRPDRGLSPPALQLAARIRLQPERRVFLGFSNAAITQPLPYLPQALTLAVARHLTDSVVAMLYAVRSVNLLVTVALFAWAIRTTPVLKAAFAALALSPMALSQSASGSSDAVTNATCFLLVAAILRFACDARPPARKGLLALAALSAAVGLCKPTYILLPLLLLAAPTSRVGGAGRLVLAIAALLAISIGFTGAWALWVGDLYSAPDTWVDLAGQLAFLRQRPLAFSSVVVTTFAKNGPRHLQEYAGVLGLLDTPLHPALLTGWAALAVGAALGDPAARLTALQRSLALSTGIAVVLTVCFVVYLVWMEPGAALVTIQGRHLIPAGPLFLAPLQGLLPLRRRSSAARALAVGIAAAAVILAATTYTVAGRFHRRDAATLQTFEALALTTAFRKTAQLDELNAVFEASGYSGAPALAYSAAVEADLEGRADAIGLYREALRLAPGALLAERPLAWLLATDARTGPDEAREAIAFARSAARASGADDPVALRILAAALARAGGYAAAARTAEVAATAARELGRGDLERRILADRQQYLENQPLEAQESS